MFKARKTAKRTALITVIVLLVTALSFATSAAVTKTINGITITTTGGSDSSSTTSVTAKASASGSGCSATAGTNTVTVTNKSGSEGVVSFSCQITLNGGTVKVGSADLGSTYSKNLANDESITITITSAATANSTTTVVFSDFEILSATAERTVTVNPGANGTVRCGNVTVTQSQNFTATYAAGLALTATAADGYEFVFWKDSNGTVLSTSASFTLKPTANMTVTPYFSNGGVFQVGSSNNGVLQVGSDIYLGLAQAISAAGSSGTIIPYKDCTVMTGSYTIPNGVTLLVPFDSANTTYTTEPGTETSYTAPSPYRILTLADGVSITVANGGKICVPSKLSGSGQNAISWNGTPTGKHGRIHMNEGSSITLQNGAALYCYGYISGEGSVTAQSGSTVWEAMQFRCWRGGTASSNMQRGVFPMSQYYVQNVEAPLTFEANSTEKVFVVFNANSNAYTTSTTFIGSGGMFIPSGSVTKRYDGNTDRLIIDVNGNLSVSALSLSLRVGLISVNLNTGNYDSMPINSNISIKIHSGTTTVNQSLSFLPGTELVLDKDANFNIASNKTVYVYDRDEWGEYAAGDLQLVVVGYSAATGATVKPTDGKTPLSGKTVRTVNDLIDAKLDINGTVNVSGSFFTTESGANIISSEKTGKIIYNTAAASDTTTRQATQSGSNITEVSINVNSAKLHNGDGSYTATTGAKSGDKFTYDYSLDKWIKGNAYDVNLDGSTSFDDVSAIINHVLGGTSLSESQLARADVDSDGVIDTYDAAAFDFNYLSNGLIGDVDQDGDVDLTDYQLVTAHISGVDTDSSHPADLMDKSYLNQSQYSSLISSYGNGSIVTQPFYAADVQTDKAVDAYDLFRLDKILNGIA